MGLIPSPPSTTGRRIIMQTARSSTLSIPKRATPCAFFATLVQVAMHRAMSGLSIARFKTAPPIPARKLTHLLAHQRCTHRDACQPARILKSDSLKEAQGIQVPSLVFKSPLGFGVVVLRALGVDLLASAE
jgi:hypothetical protein